MSDILTREQVEQRCNYFRDMGHCHVYAEDMLAHDAALRAQVATLTAERDEAIGSFNDAIGRESVLMNQLAALRARVEGLERERDKYIQAVGLATTCAGDMQIDAAHPIEMMQEVCTRFTLLTAQVADLTAKCEELERDVDMAHDCLQQSGEYVADLTARLAAKEQPKEGNTA